MMAKHKKSKKKKYESQKTIHVYFRGSEKKDMWAPKDYHGYRYDGKYFIVIDERGEWVGFYNLDVIASIIVKE